MEPFSLFNFLQTLLQPNAQQTQPPASSENTVETHEETTAQKREDFNACAQFLAQHNERVSRVKKQR